MIGNNIKRLRTEKGMTQKQLAEKLFVSAQAISRWENNEVEPSLGTITELSKIFEVSADEILGLGKAEVAPEPQTIIEKEYIYKEPPKQQLALCVKCNSPIYDKKDIHREGDDRIFCSKCQAKKREKKILISQTRRVASFGWGGAAALAVLLICGGGLGGFLSLTSALWTLLATVCAFTFLSCCILANNFVGDMTLEIFSWGFVKMPGLIFTLDLDGILWLISVKILFAILGFLLALAAGCLAIFLGGLISLFVYPYAIRKNIKRPEEIDVLI